MIHEIVKLRERYPFVNGGEIEILCMENPSGREGYLRPMVVVVPGGAYRFVSEREGMPVAMDFLKERYQVCVLKYLCSPQGATYPEQLLELAAAVDYIKKNAARLRVDPEEIFLVGFSAGGHLVADYSLESRTLNDKRKTALDTAISAVGLCYPVIDDHEDSLDNLLCGYAGEEKAALKEHLRLSRLVTADTPPTFLWTTAEDRLVPPQNSLRYALALADCGVPYELHVYPKGGHGLSNGSPEINDDLEAARMISVWTKDMARFFRFYCKTESR